jgi:hypothetical protein
VERRPEHDEKFTGEPSTGFESFGTVALARFNVCFFERRFDEALNILWRSPLENLHGQTSTPLPKAFLAAQVYRLLPHAEKAHAEYEHARSPAVQSVDSILDREQPSRCYSSLPGTWIPN